MVAREILIDRSNFLLKQGKLGSFEVVIFSENGSPIGSLSTELTTKLSQVLHKASEKDSSNRKFWEFNDFLFRVCIQRRVDSSGAFFQIIWGKKSNYKKKFTLIIPAGINFGGWKRFAIGLDSLNPNSINFGEQAFSCARLAGISRVYNIGRNVIKDVFVDALGHYDNRGSWKNGVICRRESTGLSWEQIGYSLMKTQNLVAPDSTVFRT